MLGSWVIWEILLVAHVAKLSWAFAFTYPTNDTNWARDEALRVDWTSNSDDPSTITLLLCNLWMNPPFLKTIADDGLKSIHSFTAYADASIPAGSGYQFQLVQRTNTSDNIMANSAQFSIATLQTAEARNSTSERAPILPVAIAVSVVVVVLIVAGTAWFCWFRKRRRQVRAHSRLPLPKPKRRSSAPLDPRSQVSKSPICESKPDIEERSADRGFEQHGSTSGQSPAVQKSSLPLPPPPPPSVPVEETAELPIFITPRSSRRVPNPSSHLRAPAELDTNPPSPRPKSADVGQVAEAKAQAVSAARRSKRLSLQQFLHLRKVSELEGNTKLPSGSQEPPAKTEDGIEDQAPDPSQSHPAHRSKRLSLQHLLHLRKIAELEGSSASPAQVSNTIPSTDEESQHPSSRRSHRISLHRLLRSKRQAELEENTDVLPVYSHTDADQKSHFLSPPLPLRDMDYKDPFSASQHIRRAMTPVELEATEPKGLLSPSPQRARSCKSQNLSITGVGGSSSSPTVYKDLEASDGGDQGPDNASEEVPITLMKFSTNTSTGTSGPRTLDAVEFLDLNSTDSERSQDEDLELPLDDATTSLSVFATPLGSPPAEEAGVDPFLTAAIISAAVESFRSSPTAPKPEHAEGVDHAKEAAKELPVIHEMDATHSVIKRRSKRQSSHAAAFRNEAQRRRPDFITFKKQMTEAERRAKMIAKRRRSRRRLTPKSF